MLVRAERYEAVGPIYRLAIPIYEQQRNFKALVSVYAELQQAYSRAAETKVSGRRRLASYFRVVFYGQTHFRDDHGTEWIYREPGLTSLAEASERMTAYCHSVLGHDRVQVLGAELDPSTLKETTAYVLMTHVEPLLTDNNEDDHFAVHTNVRRFFFESAVVDDSVAKTAPQVARHGLRRVFLITSKPFPSMQRRQPVTSRGEELLTPLQVACDELGNKAKHLRRILDAVEPGRPLDIKRLQLLLQGAVQPTVNAGPLAYAEAFTAAEQQKRYGQAGTDQLKESFRQLVAVCADALKANQTAIRADQVEYHRMLSESFDVMLDKLYDFFGERLLTKNEGAEETVTPTNEDHPRASMHVFDTIGGVNM
uniref:DOCKER domain-containing protein n=1 Tax=Plectus sambesii TaxID=2011161 RepID=A0A914UIY9_9BILA